MMTPWILATLLASTAEDVQTLEQKWKLRNLRHATVDSVCPIFPLGISKKKSLAYIAVECKTLEGVEDGCDLVCEEYLSIVNLKTDKQLLKKVLSPPSGRCIGSGPEYRCIRHCRGKYVPRFSTNIKTAVDAILKKHEIPTGDKSLIWYSHSKGSLDEFIHEGKTFSFETQLVECTKTQASRLSEKCKEVEWIDDCPSSKGLGCFVEVYSLRKNRSRKKSVVKTVSRAKLDPMCGAEGAFNYVGTVVQGTQAAVFSDYQHCGVDNLPYKETVKVIGVDLTKGYPSTVGRQRGTKK